MDDHEIISFDVEFLEEFLQKYGPMRGLSICMIYQIYLVDGWDYLRKVLPDATFWRVRRDLIRGGYITRKQALLNSPSYLYDYGFEET